MRAKSEDSGHGSLRRRSPCNTVILFGTTAPQQSRNRVLVVTQDNADDRAAVSLAGRLAKIVDGRVTVADIEEESGEEAIEVGNRGILQVVGDAGADQKRVRPRVFSEQDGLS